MICEQRSNQNQNTANETTWRGHFLHCFRVHYINCNDRIAGILISVVGMLTSLWANCFFVVTCAQDYDRNAHTEIYIQKIIIQTSQLSHFLIVITCTAGLLYGIKVKNKAYFSPWIFTKIMELFVIVFGIILLTTGGNRRYIGLIPIGVCFFVIGLYITLCVWHTYKNNTLEGEASRDSLEEVDVNTNHIRVNDLPPSYECHINSQRCLR